jgi:hypothetical protein
MSEREVRLLNALLTTLRSIRDGINDASKATVQAIGENTEAAHKTSEQHPPQPPTRITVDVQVPREETNGYYTEQSRGYRLQWWIFWASVDI